jgi:hypothetical protein
MIIKTWNEITVRSTVKNSYCNTRSVRNSGTSTVTSEAIRKQNILQIHISEHMPQGPLHKQAVKLINSDRKTRVTKDLGELDSLHIPNILEAE